nr:MAG TPA: hypothetical protein [Caudoviricetes sp.]
MSGRGFDFLLATLLHLLLHKSAIFSHVVRYKNSLGTRIRGFFATIRNMVWCTILAPFFI